MEKYRLYDGPVNITGRSVTADRTAVYDKAMDYRRGGWSLTYEPHGNSGEDLDVNMLVYELLLLAGRDMIEVSKTVYGGEFTAAEMAGTVHSMHQLMENCNPDWEDYKHIRIKTKTFECAFDAAVLFQQIAEWEGVCGITAAKAYRFRCDGAAMPKGTVMKKYVRCHGYHPTTISLAAEEKRINRKFEVLGRLCQSLTGEGMKKAMSVVAAARLFDNKGYEVRAMVKEAMLRKLWKDYGRDGAAASPVEFGETDFKCGPECWKQVDSGYVQVLVDHWNAIVAASPKPEWPRKGDTVQFKARESMQRKYRGKFLCEGLTAHLSPYGGRIEWRASVRVKKYDCEYFLPGQLEPAEEGRSKKTDGRSKKTQPSGKAVKVKGTDYAVKDGGKDVAFASYVPQQPSLADELFGVLLELAA